MKMFHAVAARMIAIVSSLLITPYAAAHHSISFGMQVSPGAAACLPGAGGEVGVTSLGTVEQLAVHVYGLRPDTDYDFFVIQVPNAPFGLSWYQGDIMTNDAGEGWATFIGRFSVETFIVAPNSATVPIPVHTDSSKQIVDADQGTTNPQIKNPIHTYHLGLWFNSPDDAAAAGCANTRTPFNGDHTAGIQVLNTAGFPDDQGPLQSFRP